MTEAPPGKSAEHYRLERLSWFGLVGVLIATGTVTEWLSLQHGVTPLAAGLVLLATAILELRRSGSSAISRWVASIALLLISGFNFVSRPDLDLSLLVLVVAIVLIGSGAFKRDRG